MFPCVVTVTVKFYSHFDLVAYNFKHTDLALKTFPKIRLEGIISPGEENFQISSLVKRVVK